MSDEVMRLYERGLRVIAASTVDARDGTNTLPGILDEETAACAPTAPDVDPQWSTIAGQRLLLDAVASMATEFVVAAAQVSADATGLEISIEQVMATVWQRTQQLEELRKLDLHLDGIDAEGTDEPNP